MPDLNLIDDENVEQPSPEEPEVPLQSKRLGAGGEGMRVVMILVVLAVLAGVVYMLNALGIVTIWGKKEPVVVQVQEPPEQSPARTEEQPATQAQQPSTPPAQQRPSTKEPDVKLVETPAIETAPAKTAAKPPAQTQMPTTRTAESLTDMKGGYTVQVSSWRDRETANTIMKRLVDAGYPAFVEPVQAKGMEWYTVRIGRYSSLAEAKKAVEGFALELQMRHFIGRTSLQ
jgi:cell division septation protein DedD